MHIGQRSEGEQAVTGSERRIAAEGIDVDGQVVGRDLGAQTGERAGPRAGAREREAAAAFQSGKGIPRRGRPGRCRRLASVAY